MRWMMDPQGYWSTFNCNTYDAQVLPLSSFTMVNARILQKHISEHEWLILPQRVQLLHSFQSSRGLYRQVLRALVCRFVPHRLGQDLAGMREIAGQENGGAFDGVNGVDGVRCRKAQTRCLLQHMLLSSTWTMKTCMFLTNDCDIICPLYVHVSLPHQTHILALVSRSYSGNGEIQAILRGLDWIWQHSIYIHSWNLKS